MLRLERAIYLSLTVLAVVVFWRSFVFTYRWLPIVYCGGASQSFYDWYNLFVIAPIIPFIGFVLALVLARRSALKIVRAIIAVTSAISAAVIARIFGEMMIPGAWGDCICCGGTPSLGPRDVKPPLALQLSESARSYAAVGILVVMVIVTLAILIAEFRKTDGRPRYLAFFAVSLPVLFCAGWAIVFAPGFTWWTDGWRYVAVADAIAATTCVAASVAIARKSMNALIAAVALIAFSYVVIYHAISFFGMVAA